MLKFHIQPYKEKPVNMAVVLLNLFISKTVRGKLMENIILSGVEK